jgi:terminase small subunit / prophage DNA-packing protein
MIMGDLAPFHKGGARPPVRRKRRLAKPQRHHPLALTESGRGYCARLRALATDRGGESAIASATAERARLARAQAELVETKDRKLRGELVDAAEVEAEWSGMLRGVRAGMMAVLSRCSRRLPHLTPYDVTEIDAEVREALTEIGGE